MKKIYKYQIDPEFVENKLVESKNHSRKCNLRIDVVKETSNEKEKCKEHLETLFEDTLGIEDQIKIYIFFYMIYKIVINLLYASYIVINVCEDDL